MDAILSDLLNSLYNYTSSLKKRGILVDKPWALIDNEEELQKLIFKKNKSLILSKNGQVIDGSWDYYPKARAILIDRKTDKLLLKEQYIDDNVIILKKDGTENDFFALANENTLPDLDIPKYLNSLLYLYIKPKIEKTKIEKPNIKKIKLLSGEYIKIHAPDLGNYEGKKVDKIDNSNNTVPIEDGRYLSEKKHLTFNIKNGYIKSVKINKLTNR
jgi:hypothetical protein